ncbi:MAG: M48 family metallopeptidase [Cyclobacteriaceae bacterium]|nr:M48 family metallopeptidase [Cyclobacteriaceae bacterium]
MKRISVFILLSIMLSNCATVPVTGRRQLSLVSNSEIIPMAATQYDSIVKTGPLSKNTTQTAMVRKVGKDIQAAVIEYMAQNGASEQLEGFNWEFNLIDQDIANAWCMPGGKVAFYTGIMPICVDEQGIAVVMGHEVAHAIANHGRERMSNGLLAQFGLSTVSAAMGENANLTKQIFLQSMGMGTQLGMLKFSRQHESEADKIGLIFMAMAGYDPNEAVEFWQRMSALGGQAPPEFLSTHPSHDTRIDDIKAAIPEAMKFYKP